MAAILFSGCGGVVCVSFDFAKRYTFHYKDVIMSAMASQITRLTIVYSTVCSAIDQRKHQSSASLSFVRGIHQRSMNSPHKGSVTRKMFPFDDVIMFSHLHAQFPPQTPSKQCPAPRLCVPECVQWQRWPCSTDPRSSPETLAMCRMQPHISGWLTNPSRTERLPVRWEICRS